jgi:3-methylcrotonyl-CoA carboxylase alpha subunit
VFNKILIANRGEIACRIARTCRRLGVQTVAVYSDADANALHVEACDEAFHIGGSAPKDSYLLGEKIIQIALAAGAQAIHPGYGFLSENADFAEACEKAGLVFIGPPVQAIRAMGSKSAAKSLMENAQVPLVPGYHGDEQDPNFLRSKADDIGYPVLLKASAGGGGKGMRIVQDSASFIDALDSCKREARSSFGDEKVLVEKYLERPRHIEIQVFADKKGNCVYLFDRDCSVQRRHQKVLEEAPAPKVSPEIKRAMGEAAVNAAKAVGYEGAGTVEFIAQADQEGNAGHFFFMEMNTRLQVEHPVTEMVSGQDLVEWQLRVASGEALPLLQDQLQLHGHAIEARIYAENPENQFLPSTGKLLALEMPDELNHEIRHEIRIDTGVRSGDLISPFYDPMIAKLIIWGNDREAAVSRMRSALDQTHIVGLHTNVAFLGRLLRCEPFCSAHLDTGLIARNEQYLLNKDTQVNIEDLAFLLANRLTQEAKATAYPGSETASPWQAQDGWRMNGFCERTFAFSLDGLPEEVRSIHYCYQTQVLSYEGKVVRFEYRSSGSSMVISIDGQKSSATVIANPANASTLHLFRNGRHQVWHYQNPLEHSHVEEGASGKLTAPMPGKVVAIQVKVGDQVKIGDSLIVVEAMKMEHLITAPFDGEIEEINYAQGDQVNEGDQLIIFKSQDD